MPVERVSSAQFLDRLRTSIQNRSTSRYDTGYGPILDTILRPVSDVLEDQNNNRLRRVSLLLSLLNEEEFTDDDLDAFVFNEDILRPDGSFSTATLTFQRNTPFSSSENGVIQRGFPVGTAIDEGTGQVVTFITTESKDKTSAVAVLDTTTNRTVYKVRVSALALTRGEAGRVTAGLINRPLRPLVGYDSVTNEEDADGGRDRYTNAELIELYLLAVTSRQLSVPSGSEFYIRDTFLNVDDVHEVYGTNELLTRAATDAGAVDAFIISSSTSSETDALTYLGIGQIMRVSSPPVVQIDSVVRASDSTVFVEGEDYEVVLDTSGLGSSSRARDGIRFLPTVSPAPTAGEVINVTYTVDQTVRDVQEALADPEVAVFGKDLLIRRGQQLDIILEADLRVRARFNPETVQTLVESAILSYVNGLGLGDDIEISDLQATVRRLSGVDNFIVTRLVSNEEDEGNIDLSIADNQYPRISQVNLRITRI